MSKEKPWTIGQTLRFEAKQDAGWTYDRFGFDERMPFKKIPSREIFDAKKIAPKNTDIK